MLINKSNWQNVKQNESTGSLNQSQIEYMEKMKGIDIQKDKYESEKKGLAIEIEIELEYDLSMCAGTIMHFTEMLLTQ